MSEETTDNNQDSAELDEAERLKKEREERKAAEEERKAAEDAAIELAKKSILDVSFLQVGDMTGEDALAQLAALEKQRSGSNGSHTNGKTKAIEKKTETSDVKLTDEQNPPFWSY